jgi:hypothetical protein
MDKPNEVSRIKVLPSFRRENQRSLESVRLARREVSKRRKAANRSEVEKLRPIDTSFLVALCSNGGNPGAAAEEVGLSRATGQRWVKERKHIREAYQAYLRSAHNRLQDWAELLPKAQLRLVSLMDSKSDVVSLAAAREILARGLGPVVQAVEPIQDGA